jgi:hypothetical protein
VPVQFISSGVMPATRPDAGRVARHGSGCREVIT